MPHQSVPHGEADYVVCTGCFRDVEIDWGETQLVGIALCQCDRRYAYKHKYKKLVRA